MSLSGLLFFWAWRFGLEGDAAVAAIFTCCGPCLPNSFLPLAYTAHISPPPRPRGPLRFPGLGYVVDRTQIPDLQQSVRFLFRFRVIVSLHRFCWLGAVVPI